MFICSHTYTVGMVVCTFLMLALADVTRGNFCHADHHTDAKAQWCGPLMVEGVKTVVS